MESKDEEIVRIVNCINSCWPEYPFTYADIRKPTGEKFRDVLNKFLHGFLGGNHQLPNVLLINLISSTPEMFAHLQGNISLYRSINSILKSVKYHEFKYGTMLKPTSNAVKDVLVVLVNFLAYFEAEEANKEEIESEMQTLKQKTKECNKRLVEEDKYLGKCRENVEENKIMETELRQIVVGRKEKYMMIENVLTKLESDADDLTKRMQNINITIEKASITLKQVELEKERVAEELVQDPEALEAEFARSRYEKDTMEADFSSIKNRLPTLEKQIQDRALQLQEHQETHQRLAQVKTRESKTKQEWQNIEAEYRRVGEEKQILENTLKTDTSLIDSKKRMLIECEQKVEYLREQLEKTRSDVKQCLNEDEHRKAQLEARTLAAENEISRLKHDLNQGQKALEEGSTLFEAIDIKHQRDVEHVMAKHDKLFQAIEKSQKKFP